MKRNERMSAREKKKEEEEGGDKIYKYYKYIIRRSRRNVEGRLAI